VRLLLDRVHHPAPQLRWCVDARDGDCEVVDDLLEGVQFDRADGARLEVTTERRRLGRLERPERIRGDICAAGTRVAA
jgi:hypothetical protein